jgi:hypothetical protein
MKTIVAILKWFARILSLLSIGTLLLFIFGEGFNPGVVVTQQGIMLMFFPIGIITGMIIAWWSEGLGGSITILSLVCFYLLDYIFYREFPQGLAFLAFSAPGIVFVLYSILTFNARHRNAIY